MKPRKIGPEIEYLVYTKNLLHSMQSKPLAATQKSTSFHKVSLKLVPKISYDAWKRDDAKCATFQTNVKK